MTTLTLDTTVDERLEVLAASINIGHSIVLKGLRSTVSNAISIGQSLIEAKTLVLHGQWTAWIEEHCEFNERTAQRYMRLARKMDSCPRDLTIEQALDLFTIPKDPAEDQLPAEVERPANPTATSLLAEPFALQPDDPPAQPVEVEPYLPFSVTPIIDWREALGRMPLLLRALSSELACEYREVLLDLIEAAQTALAKAGAQ